MLSPFWHETRSPGVKTQIGERPASAPQFASGPLGNVEEIAFGQKMLLSIHL
jgi:hypothetical protein